MTDKVFQIMENSGLERVFWGKSRGPGRPRVGTRPASGPEWGRRQPGVSAARGSLSKGSNARSAVPRMAGGASEPARMPPPETGSIQPGKTADLVVLDHHLRIRTVIAEGTVVHRTASVDGKDSAHR